MVDDEPDFAVTLGEGLDWLSREFFDCLILDESADGPDLKGLERIRSAHPSLPVVVLTGESNADFCQEVLKRGAQDLLAVDSLDAFDLARSIRFSMNRHSLLVACERSRVDLAETENRFRILVEENADGLLVVDESGRVFYANPAAVDILGRPENEITGQPFGFPVIDARPMELEILRSDGERAKVEMLASEVEWEGAAAYLVSLRDVTARSRREDELTYRVELERLITSISTMFVTLDPDRIDFGVKDGVRSLAEFCEVDRAFVYLFNQERTRLDLSFEWCAQGVGSRAGHDDHLNVDDFSWLMERLRIFETALVSDVAELPKEAIGERDFLHGRGTRTMIVVSMSDGPERMGFLGFEAVRRDRMWSEEEIGLLKVAGDIFVQSLLRKRREEERRSTASLLEALLQNEEIGLLVLESNRTVARVNQRFCDLLRLDARSGELMGEDARDLLRRDQEAFVDGFGKLRETLLDPEGSLTAQRLAMRDGSELEMDVIRLEGESGGRLLQCRDVTERRREERDLKSNLRRDMLTGLSNRHRFLEDAALLLDDAAAKGEPAALLLVDLDHFRNITNTFGFDVGDEVLRQSAHRLGEIASGGDLLGRLGGDEFAVLTTTNGQRGDVEAFARRVLRALGKPFLVGERSIESGASIGISFHTAHGESAEDLLLAADMALVRAKEQGRGQFMAHNHSSCLLR